MKNLSFEGRVRDLSSYFHYSKLGKIADAKSSCCLLGLARRSLTEEAASMLRPRLIVASTLVVALSPALTSFLT